jgi:hypothetical protein
MNKRQRKKAFKRMVAVIEETSGKTIQQWAYDVLVDTLTNMYRDLGLSPREAAALRSDPRDEPREDTGHPLGCTFCLDMSKYTSYWMRVEECTLPHPNLYCWEFICTECQKKWLVLNSQVRDDLRCRTCGGPMLRSDPQPEV